MSSQTLRLWYAREKMASLRGRPFRCVLSVNGVHGRPGALAASPVRDLLKELESVGGQTMTPKPRRNHATPKTTAMKGISLVELTVTFLGIVILFWFVWTLQYVVLRCSGLRILKVPKQTHQRCTIVHVKWGTLDNTTSEQQYTCIPLVWHNGVVM